MTIEEINKHLSKNYTALTITNVLTWMLSEYVKTDTAHPSTDFPKHDPENILRTGALSGLVSDGEDYVRRSDVETLAKALFGTDNRGYCYAKRKKSNVHYRDFNFIHHTELNFNH